MCPPLTSAFRERITQQFPGLAQSERETITRSGDILTKTRAESRMESEAPREQQDSPVVEVKKEKVRNRSGSLRSEGFRPISPDNTNVTCGA